MQTRIYFKHSHTLQLYRLSDTLRKELQRTIAIHIYSEVVCKKDSLKEMDRTMETLFFGNVEPQAISYIDLYLNGGDVFKFMFEQLKNPGKLKLKQMFPRFFSIDKDPIKKKALSRNEARKSEAAHTVKLIHR